MRRQADPRDTTERETLICFALLRQMETPCQALRDAYQRLIEAASGAKAADMRTVILDWLEAELGLTRAAGAEAGRRGAQLMKGAVALSKALRQ